MAISSRVSNKAIILLAVVGLLIVIELVWGISYLRKVPQPTAPAAAEEGARLMLSPAQKVVKVGEELEVELILDTRGVETSGADVIISYDPTLVEILDGDENPANGIQVRPGLLYQKYPVNEVDIAGGKIGFSGIATPPKTFAGKGTLAYIKLRTLGAGTAALTIEFTKGATIDSNVVQAESLGKDILDKVIDARYSIKD